MAVIEFIFIIILLVLVIK
jgi:hypothetical protein